MRICWVWVLVLWAAILSNVGCNLPSDDWASTASTSTDTGSGGTGGAPTCDADCRPVRGWLGPSLFAIGPSTDLPACPEDLAPYPGIELHDGLSAPPLDCPVCQCDASETECAVPTDWHASAAKCADANLAAHTDFSAPPQWPGTCTTENAIPAGALCNGVPCVQSVTVQPPQIAAAPCSAKAIGGSAPPIAWDTRARECLPADPRACPEEPPACWPPSGFSLCVHRSGDLACEAPYTDRHLLFGRYEDHRGCSPCACGPPVDNACVVFVSAYAEPACGAVAGAIHVASGEGEGCFDVPVGFPLGAKTAEVIVAQKGSCTASGGEPDADGVAVPAQPVTVCCRWEEKVPE